MTFEFSGRNVSTDQKQIGELKALHAELTRLDSGTDATAGLDLTTADQALKPVKVEFLKVSSGITELAPIERQPRNNPASLTNLLRDGWLGQDQPTQLVSGLQGVGLTSLVGRTSPQCNLPPVDPRRMISSPQLLSAAPLAAIDLNQTFLLSSLPGANHTIYLDFNGHTTTGTAWNNSYGSNIVTPAFDIDGNTAAFSNAELERIQYIWQRVAEDFSPFNVNVTTQEPTLDRLIKSGSTDTAWGVRVAIGGSSYDWFAQGAGGVAYLGSFNWNTDTPAFVFTAQLGTGNEKYTAEAISHEVGHTLGLNHDGRTSPSEGYYAGHGSGETGWAPIMGVGYYQNLVQWSKGEYLAANNTEDDLAIITGQNGFGYRADDTGSTLGTAKALTVFGTTVSASGIIERNTDVDFFSFTTGAGAISLAITPSGRGSNLDILAELYDATGTLVATSNPADLLAASINATVGAGTYYLKVDGTGKGDPLGTGYSDYGSLGQYGITGTIISSNAPPTLAIAATNASQTEGNSGSKAFTFTVSRSGSTSGSNAVNWAVTGSGANPADATDFANTILPSGTLSFAAGETSKVITVNVKGDSTVEFDETFTVTLSNPTNGATLTTATAVGTILNDDLPVITISANDPNAGETANPGAFTLTRTGPTTSALTVNLGIGGSATNGTDYVTLATTAVFAIGATTAVVPLTPVDDLVVEGNETAILTLLNGSGYILGSATSATVILADNDLNGNNSNNTLTGDGGNNALNGLGGNDVLNGGAGSDRLNGGVGKDTLTGGSDIDQFVLGALGDSLLAGFDVITDYALGEQIDAPATIAASTLTASSGNATSLTATAIQAVLTSGVFTANSARAFTVTGRTGTFIALNDGTAGFSASTDSIIHLSNYIIGATNTVAIV